MKGLYGAQTDVGYARAMDATCAPTPVPPTHIVRYVPSPRGEKIDINPRPELTEHHSQSDAELFALSLVRGGNAEWGSVEIYANTGAEIVVEIRQSQAVEVRR